jgi:N-acetylglucosaminylphosphatidylinositol deacetylase
MIVWIVAGILVMVVSVVSALWTSDRMSRLNRKTVDGMLKKLVEDSSGVTTILIAFAHPDDEAMFFSPLLRELQLRKLAGEKLSVRFLCFSNGNFGGLGKIREKELEQSARFYSVDDVVVINSELLKDGMQEEWPPEVVAEHLTKYAALRGPIDVIVTFDQLGVSQHPNHIAVHYGVQTAQIHPVLQRTKIYGLHSRALLAKYTSALSIIRPAQALINPTSASRATDGSASAQSAIHVFIRPEDASCSFRGMQQHPSQLVWFRYLFVWFSSYTFYNEYRRLA